MGHTIFMHDIVVLAVGKIKESYFSDACQEYVKRLSLYVRISFHEIPYEPFRSRGEMEKAKKKEGERIAQFLKKRKDTHEIFILDEKGKESDSKEFAVILEKLSKPAIFVVGGSLGIHKDAILNSYKKISLSHLTFPHELARVVLLEQIYRAMTIMRGKEYHY